MEEIRYVIHVASPFPLNPPRDHEELVKPAVNGTLSVLKAAAASKSVKRVVITGSMAAIVVGQQDTNHIYDEKDWIDLKNPKLGAYEKSKALAEKSAWDFAKNLPENQKFDLVVLNPGTCLGPPLHEMPFTCSEV